MLFSEFKALRMAELMQEQWGRQRIPDLLEIFYNGCRPRSVLETGSYRGVSTEFWALHCARVVSVDPSPNMAVRRELHARLAHYPHVRLVEQRSPWVPADKFDFDLVYLDGDHSYATVRAELDTYLSLLRPGAWIGGHDYTDTPTPGDGVKDAVDQVLGVPSFRFSDGSWLHQL